MTKLYLVRHGETLFNLMKKMQGWADSPLTRKGWADAAAAGDRLAGVDFEAVYSSDMQRAINTAKVIIKHNQIHPDATVQADKNFREVFFGTFEGLSRQETWAQVGRSHGLSSKDEILRAVGIETARQWMKDADPLSMAENDTELWQRVHRGLALFEDEQPRNILIATHGTLIKTIAAKYGDQTIATGATPNNGSCTILGYSHGDWQVEQYNVI